MLVGATDIAQRVGAEFSPARAIVEDQTGHKQPPESGPPPPPPPGLIGNVELSASGQPSVVVAATVVGFVPPAGLMVQVQLEPTASDAERAEDERVQDADQANLTDPEEAARAAPGAEAAVRSTDELSNVEAAVVQDMQARDASVRREEQAHAAVAGAMAGPIQYEYKTGPDGRRYVVNGQVSIRYSTPSGNPTDTANAGRKLAAAAMAAQAPSAADYAAAAEGYRVAGDADRVSADQTLTASRQAAEEAAAPFALSV